MESYENNYPSFEKPIESNINEDNAPAPSAFPPPSPPIINDIYLESTENNYHDVSQMKSIIALTNEKEMCDIIIKYKKDNNFNNYDIWNKKSEKIDAQLSDIFSLFNSRVMNNTRYIRCIQKQLEYEKNLLNISLQIANLLLNFYLLAFYYNDRKFSVQNMLFVKYGV